MLVVGELSTEATLLGAVVGLLPANHSFKHARITSLIYRTQV